VPYSPPGGIDSCSVKRPWRRGPARADSAADAASRREDDAKCPHSPLPKPSTARSAARSSSRSGTSTTTCACFTTSAAPRASAPRSRFAAPPAGRPSRAVATCLLTCTSAATATPRSGIGRGRRVRSACAVGLGIAAAERPSFRAKIGRSPAGRRRGVQGRVPVPGVVQAVLREHRLLYRQPEAAADAPIMRGAVLLRGARHLLVREHQLHDQPRRHSAGRVSKSGSNRRDRSDGIPRTARWRSAVQQARSSRAEWSGVDIVPVVRPRCENPRT